MEKGGMWHDPTQKNIIEQQEKLHDVKNGMFRWDLEDGW